MNSLQRQELWECILLTSTQNEPTATQLNRMYCIVMHAKYKDKKTAVDQLTFSWFNANRPKSDTNVHLISGKAFSESEELGKRGSYSYSRLG